MRNGSASKYGVVAIGRNEGERLKKCLGSKQDCALTVYVDSGSTDGSVEWARDRGLEVAELDIGRGFTAARARNLGFARLRELAPQIAYVQFVDGDCELVPGWTKAAVEFLETHSGVCAVFGRRRERHPDQSVYNWLCDREWNVSLGEARACGGDVMMRTDALATAGGYREDMIAGEEPELCFRLRSAGWSIWRIDHDMTLHDANIKRFGQWWRRMVRSGYAFAAGSHLHGASPERFWVWESRRAWFWAAWLPLFIAAAVACFGWTGSALLLAYPLQLCRQALRASGSSVERGKIAVFQLLARFAEAVGQLIFLYDRLSRGRRAIMEYKK